MTLNNHPNEVQEFSVHCREFLLVHTIDSIDIDRYAREVQEFHWMMPVGTTLDVEQGQTQPITKLTNITSDKNAQSISM